MKVTELAASRGDQPVFICDFSPPRFVDWNVVQRAAELSADFLCVAYNPGKAVRVDSAMLASAIKTHTGKETVFNLATRDMNRLALQTHLLGAQMLGLENVVVVKGDDFSGRDLERVRPVDDYLPTELIQGAAALNDGTDFRGSQLRTPSDLCIGASIDLGRGVQAEAALAHRKVQAGAQFFITQPVFSVAEIDAFHAAYREASGNDVEVPVFFGLQVMIADGVVFSGVPDRVKEELDKGREGSEMALELLQRFTEHGINRIYLVPPIMKGGARDYPAAQRVLDGFYS